jgi:hypothetical protein
MVLGGRVNKSLVSLIQQAGGTAVGLCGKDGDLLRARQMVEKDIGFVGGETVACFLPAEDMCAARRTWDAQQACLHCSYCRLHSCLHCNRQ